MVFKFDIIIMFKFAEKVYIYNRKKDNRRGRYTMDESRIIEMIKRNPSIIKTISNPTDEMKILAIKEDGLVLRYINNPTVEMQNLAIENNPRAIR